MIAVRLSRLAAGLWGYLAAAGAIVAGLTAWGGLQRAKGRSAAEVDALKDKQKRMEEGREAVNDLRGISRASQLEQLRKNEGQW